MDTVNWHDEPATPAQIDFITGLRDSRVIDTDLRAQIAAGESTGFTKRDAAELIPLLQACRTVGATRASERDVYENYASPVDWGDENPGYSSPDSPSGYEPV